MNRAAPPAWWPRWRRFKDRCATALISSGGGVVLFTILMLFIFLVYEISPLLRPATMAPQPPQAWRTVEAPAVRWLSSDEYGVLAFSISEAGNAAFSRLQDGTTMKTSELAGPGRELTTLAVAGTGQDSIGLGFGDGSVQVVNAGFGYSFEGAERRVSPILDYPYGVAPRVLRQGNPVHRLALCDSCDTLVVQFADGELDILHFGDGGGSSDRVPETHSLGLQPRAAAIHVLENRWLLLLEENGSYRLWPLPDPAPSPLHQGRLFPAGESLTASTVLQGGQSLVAASSANRLARYYIMGGGQVRVVHQFDTGGDGIEQLLPEHRRRGFLALGGDSLSWFNATSGARAFRAPMVPGLQAMALSPRADTLLAVDSEGSLRRWILDNPHPEVSLASLWRRVWYEGYESPALIYQSSASSNNYESKYSMTPLAFGTLKAAFYAMLFATPLAIGGAIYTAFFMAPALRRRIKPTIELMEALPTVILGFLAGLWLAPLVENNLSQVLSLGLTVPLGVLLFAALWSRLPPGLRNLVPDGWHAVILLPVILVLCWWGFSLGGPVEALLFGGDARQWLKDELGLAYDQRNALVVGIAMGFAVIPTIFSIAEDAIYSVPRHLSYGSLALGATPWQTLVGVVLPTASPGVFSGVMIGFGRAVGETMIVLMATGNTPIMDANLFEGMRTLAANIAVEVPEAEVDSTHYRILFLAAFLLFLFTFAVNTMAEVVRQRLRARYGALG